MAASGRRRQQEITRRLMPVHRIGLRTTAGAVSAMAISIFAAVAANETRAQADYPQRPVRMVVPFAPGGASDFVGRIMQAKMSEVLGQQLVIDNRTGAAGNIGVEVAARASPDGYTILLGNIGTMAINPGLYLKFPVKPT